MYGPFVFHSNTIELISQLRFCKEHVRFHNIHVEILKEKGNLLIGPVPETCVEELYDYCENM
jgi:hypothetical protein